MGLSHKMYQICVLRSTLAINQVCKAAAKLRLLEYGLLTAANWLDDVSLANQKGQGKERDIKETVEDFEKRVGRYLEEQLRKTPSARRGDYKDGPVYQARKQVIEGFIKTAHSNSKRCSRPECGA
jgi:DNA-directed RNA polymerase I subunit RPA1